MMRKFMMPICLRSHADGELIASARTSLPIFYLALSKAKGERAWPALRRRVKDQKSRIFFISDGRIFTVSEGSALIEKGNTLLGR
jgi:hypothetical protein